MIVIKIFLLEKVFYFQINYCFFPVFSFSDPAEIPVCEISLACDNLLCDGHGRPPNPVLEIDIQSDRSNTWIKYARTEVVEVNICGHWNHVSSKLFQIIEGQFISVKSFGPCIIISLSLAYTGSFFVISYHSEKQQPWFFNNR